MLSFKITDSLDVNCRMSLNDVEAQCSIHLLERRHWIIQTYGLPWMEVLR